MKGKYTLASDIDVLVVTKRKPAEVIAVLWEKGIKEPFEIHVISKELLTFYTKRAKLVRIA